MADAIATPVGINLSGGASSLWQLGAVVHGELPRPEHIAAFFADTGDEHAWTYDELGLIDERCRAAGVPFFQTATHRKETLGAAIMSATRGERTRLDNPPFWTENPGGGRGQLRQECTQVWKTRPIRASQSLWLKALGLPKKITTWIGFANDEQHRAMKALKKADVRWAKLDFPAIRLGVSRGQQRADLTRWGWKPPMFSMCKFCPYKTPKRWAQTPEHEVRDAIEIDEAIRHGLEGVGVDEPAYLSDRLIPVETLVRRGDPQPDLPGMESCDSGGCFL